MAFKDICDYTNIIWIQQPLMLSFQFDSNISYFCYRVYCQKKNYTISMNLR